jgi:hypothetical protein
MKLNKITTTKLKCIDCRIRIYANSSNFRKFIHAVKAYLPAIWNLETKIVLDIL